VVLRMLRPDACQVPRHTLGLTPASSISPSGSAAPDRRPQRAELCWVSNSEDAAGSCGDRVGDGDAQDLLAGEQGVDLLRDSGRPVGPRWSYLYRPDAAQKSTQPRIRERRSAANR
jgi:hypothetical protein